MNGNSNLSQVVSWGVACHELHLVSQLPDYEDALVEFSGSVAKSMFAIMCIDGALIEA